jgi:peptidoglycan/LPS O-acetylase OafA/YrhL
LVVGLAVAAVIQVRLAMVAAASALVSVGATLLLMYGDFSEGISVAFDYGMPVSAILAGLLLRTGARERDDRASAVGFGC